MKYFAYMMVWVCTAAVIICAIMFEDAVWTVLGLLIPVGIPFPQNDAADIFTKLIKPDNTKKEKMKKE